MAFSWCSHLFVYQKLLSKTTKNPPFFAASPPRTFWDTDWEKAPKIKTLTRTSITARWLKCAQIHICTFCFALFSRLTFKLRMLNPPREHHFQHFNPTADSEQCLSDFKPLSIILKLLRHLLYKINTLEEETPGGVQHHLLAKICHYILPKNHKMFFIFNVWLFL